MVNSFFLRTGLTVLSAMVVVVFVKGANAQTSRETPAPDFSDQDTNNAAGGRYVDPAPTPSEPQQSQNRIAPESESATANSSSALTIAKWGGAYGQAIERAIVKPFAKQNALTVQSVTHKAPRGKEISILENSETPPDLIELSAGALERACTQGLITNIDAAGLATSNEGESITDDFVVGGLHACGVGTFAWSSLFVSTATTKKGKRAMRLKNVFDAKLFPGKRVLVRSPRYLFETALLADGVAPEEIYPTLESTEGLERVFSVLDGLGSNVLWVKNISEALDLLKNGEAQFSQIFTGRLFYEQLNGSEFYPIFDGHVYAINYLAIPKKARHGDKALSLLKFATAPDRLAAVSSLYPYGPMRKSAALLVKSHALLNVPLDSYLTTRAQSLARGFALDEVWWEVNGAKMDQAFEGWLASKNSPPDSEDSSDTANP